MRKVLVTFLRGETGSAGPGEASSADTHVVNDAPSSTAQAWKNAAPSRVTITACGTNYPEREVSSVGEARLRPEDVRSCQARPRYRPSRRSSAS